jgi:hypothetical protein
MRSIGFFTFLFFLGTDFAWSQSSSCRGVEDRIQDTATYVKKNFKEQDVAPDVEYIEQLATTCKVNIAKFGWGRGLFDYWKNTGYEAELDKAKEQSEYYAKFKDVSPELERYRRYASKLKMNPQEIDSYISKYRTQGLASARAEEKKCQPAIDLRNQALGEVRDQDSIGWCYAFAGADLLTYKLGKKVSAVDVAMNYNDGWFKNTLKRVGWGEQDFQGATPQGMGTAIDNTKAKGGACLEANLRSEDNGYSTIMSNLTEIDNLKKKSGTLNSMTCPSVVQRVFPTIQAKEFLEISENASRATLISMLSDKACKPRLSLKGVEVEYTSPSFLGDTTEVLNQIDRQLSRKNILALAYNAQFLYDRNSKKNGGHASTIVGRRFNKSNGECEYLVRNSWGRGCSSYDPYYTCEAGNIWIPKSVVSKGVINVSFIK